MEEVWLGSRVLQPRRELMAGGERLPIGKRALDILSVLAEARGRIVTKDELFEAVWSGVVVEENALQAHIATLRKALGPDADRLKTIRGIGYQLDIDPEADADLVPPGPSWANGGFAEIPRHNGNGALLEAGNSAHAIPARRAALISRGVATSPKVRWPRLGLAAALVLVVLLIGWAIAEFRPGSRDPIQVVVRPLTSGSGGQTETGLANGITDELIDRLRRIPELRVATVAADGEVREASFKNAYVVDGSIRRGGDQLRVTARLSDAKGEILWSQTFDRRLVDLLDMQERIAASVANALSVSFDVGVDSTAYGGTDDPEAYAAYLEGTLPGFNIEIGAQRSYLERALAIDPDYIRALVALAGTYMGEAHISIGLTRQQVLALLAKAVAVNPDLWIGHAARGAYYLTRRDYGAADRSYQRVAELDNGNDPDLKAALAQRELVLGRTNKALALLASGEAIDPMSRNSFIRVLALFDQGRYRETIDLAEKIAAGEPAILRNMAAQIFWSRLGLKQEAEAIRFSERYFPAWADDLRSFRADKALPNMSPAELRQWADRLVGDGAQILVANNALFAGYNGYPQLAVELMRVALERPGGGAVYQLWYPAMAGARKTDAFEKLVTDLGLVKVWRESGDWGDYCRPVSQTEIACT